MLLTPTRSMKSVSALSDWIMHSVTSDHLTVYLERKSYLQIFRVLFVKYSLFSGFVVIAHNRETRTSFPLVKRLNLCVLLVTCEPCITHTAYAVKPAAHVK